MAAAPFGGRWEGWAERRADARSVMCITVSTPTDAPRGRASTSSGQAPVLSATPGARDRQGPACDRPPGTVRVTPATLAETSLADGSNAPSLGLVGSLFRGGLPPFGLLEAAKAAGSRQVVVGRATAPAFARCAALRILNRAPEPAATCPLGSAPLTGDRDGRRAARQGPRSIRSRHRKVAGLTSPPCNGTSAGWHGRKLGRAERGWRRRKGGNLLGLGRGGVDAAAPVVLTAPATAENVLRALGRLGD